MAEGPSSTGNRVKEDHERRGTGGKATEYTVMIVGTCDYQWRRFGFQKAKKKHGVLKLEEWYKWICCVLKTHAGVKRDGQWWGPQWLGLGSSGLQWALWDLYQARASTERPSYQRLSVVSSSLGKSGWLLCIPVHFVYFWASAGTRLAACLRFECASQDQGQAWK